MRIKIKTQKGFIQIPLLATIIVFIMATSAITAGIVLHKQGKLIPFVASISQVFKETEDITKTSQQEEELRQARIEIEKANAEEAQRIIELEQRIKELETKEQESALEDFYDSFQETEEDSEIITADDLDTILRCVGQITCSSKDVTAHGSASIWIVNWSWGKNLVLTNAHVFSFPKLVQCFACFDYLGIYDLDIDPISSMSLNTSTDYAFIEIKSLLKGTSGVSIDSLTSKLNTFSHCPKEMPLGSPVAVIGFPVSAISQDVYRGTDTGIHNKAVTTGVISSHDWSPLHDDYPDVNYFVSAKIDKGNSGGLAVSKHNGEVCILGIPTWVKEGYFENIGIIQSIHNVWE